MKMQSLAEALAVIAKEGNNLESIADTVLQIVKSKKIKTLKDFKVEIRAAYKANGWNATAGKPVKGSTAKPVPNMVKQYVSFIRGAFAMDLPVITYTSFYALRKELKEKKAALRAKAVKKIDPQLQGLRVVKPDELIDAPMHDLVVLYEHLDRTKKPKMLAAVSRIVREFQHSVPELRLAA